MPAPKWRATQCVSEINPRHKAPKNRPIYACNLKRENQPFEVFQLYYPLHIIVFLYRHNDSDNLLFVDEWLAVVDISAEMLRGRWEKIKNQVEKYVLAKHDRYFDVRVSPLNMSEPNFETNLEHLFTKTFTF
jgi:predicted double-glycine peptidase